VPSPLLETVETVTATVGGCATLGSIIFCAREAARDEPRWNAAIGYGGVAGALVGAVFLVVDMANRV
jgi:hypothetical protein